MENKTYGLLRNLATPAKAIIETLQKQLLPKPMLIAERFRFHKGTNSKVKP